MRIIRAEELGKSPSLDHSFSVSLSNVIKTLLMNKENQDKPLYILFQAYKDKELVYVQEDLDVPTLLRWEDMPVLKYEIKDNRIDIYIQNYMV